MVEANQIEPHAVELQVQLLLKFGRQEQANAFRWLFGNLSPYTGGC